MKKKNLTRLLAISAILCLFIAGRSNLLDGINGNVSTVINYVEAADTMYLDCYQDYQDPNWRPDWWELVCRDPQNNPCVMYYGHDFHNIKHNFCTTIIPN